VRVPDRHDNGALNGIPVRAQVERGFPVQTRCVMTGT